MSRKLPMFTFSVPGQALDFASVEGANRITLGESLVRHGVRTSARRLQRCFRRCASVDQVLNLPEVRGVAEPAAVIALFADIAALWNYTPRADLNGRRPAELYCEALMAGSNPDDPQLLARTRFVPPDTIVEMHER